MNYLNNYLEHPDFEIWKEKGELPQGMVNNLCQPLKTDSRYEGQPGRFYSSAISMVDFVYKSWLKVRKSWTYELKRQERWLSMLKSDEELVKECDLSLKEIKGKATEFINNIKLEEDKNIYTQLFDLYNNSEDVLVQSILVNIAFNFTTTDDSFIYFNFSTTSKS